MTDQPSTQRILTHKKILIFGLVTVAIIVLLGLVVGEFGLRAIYAYKLRGALSDLNAPTEMGPDVDLELGQMIYPVVEPDVVFRLRPDLVGRFRGQVVRTNSKGWRDDEFEIEPPPKGDTVLVRVENEDKLRVPIHTLGSIVCFGQVSCSPFLMGLCGENNVTLSFLTERGKFLARVHGPVRGNVLLRREQYRQADDPTASANVARSIVTAKLANCRSVIVFPEPASPRISND